MFYHSSVDCQGVMRGGNDTGVWCAEITGAAEKPKLAQREQIIVMAQTAV